MNKELPTASLDQTGTRLERLARTSMDSQPHVAPTTRNQKEINGLTRLFAPHAVHLPRLAAVSRPLRLLTAVANLL